MRKALAYLIYQAYQAICVFGLLCVMMCAFTSCHWHEAKEVIATADSLDQTKHVIYDDTATLGKAIRSLDNPFGRLLMPNTLGKAYYYMGRNYSLSNQIPKAADCYIEADRLQIDAPTYRGRVNSCMGYICAQNNNDSLALIFYKRASKDFQESSNEWYYAQTLLDRSEFNINLHNYNVADTLLLIAKGYQLDSAYQARYYETRGLYFYEQQQYDSALVYFQKGLEYWQSEQDKCFSWLKMMQIYYRIDQLESAVPYAAWIIANSYNPNYCLNAHYVLIENAKANNNVELLATYSHQREDINRLLEQQNERYALANQHLQTYLSNPHPWRWIRIVLFTFVVMSIVLIVCIFTYRKYAITRMQVSDEQIVSLSAQIKKQTDELNQYNTQHFYDKRLDKIRRKCPKPLHQWNEYDQLKKDVNPYLQSWLIALEKLNLTPRENVLCVLSFIYPQMSIEDLASSMCITKDALMVRKTRLTKKIGITSAQLNSFLQKLPINE